MIITKDEICKILQDVKSDPELRMEFAKLLSSFVEFGALKSEESKIILAEICRSSRNAYAEKEYTDAVARAKTKCHLTLS